MLELTIDNNTHNRLRRYPHAQSFRGRVGNDVKRSPRRFNPTVTATPAQSKPIAEPYSRRPSANSFINDVMAVQKIASQHRPVRSSVLKRQAVVAPHADSPQLIHREPTPKSSRKKTRMIITSMALMIFVAGTWVSFSAWQTLATR